MRFFAKLVFICNLCFVSALVIRYIELNKRASGDGSEAIPFQPLESTIIVLGYTAILINVFFFLMGMYSLLSKRKFIVSVWVTLFNFLVFPVQVFYFFF